jgi:hypothetical protein
MDLVSVLVRRVERLEECCETNKLKIKELERYKIQQKSDFIHDAKFIENLNKTTQNLFNEKYAEELYNNLDKSNEELIKYPSFFDEMAEKRNVYVDKINDLIIKYLVVTRLYDLGGDDENYKRMLQATNKIMAYKKGELLKCEEKHREIYDLRLQAHNEEMSRTGDTTPFEPYQPIYYYLPVSNATISEREPLPAISSRRSGLGGRKKKTRKNKVLHKR